MRFLNSDVDINKDGNCLLILVNGRLESFQQEYDAKLNEYAIIRGFLGSPCDEEVGNAFTLLARNLSLNNACQFSRRVVRKLIAWPWHLLTLLSLTHMVATATELMAAKPRLLDPHRP